MMGYPSLREPLEHGVFDPFTRVVRVPLSPGDVVRLLNSIAVGRPRFAYSEWRDVHNLLHEILHFYQFSTTAFGWLYTLLSCIQLVSVHFLLQEIAASGKGPCAELPLVCRSNQSIRQAGGSALAVWSLVVLMERSKRALLPPLSEALQGGSDTQELSPSETELAREYAREQLGLNPPDVTALPSRSDRGGTGTARPGLYGVHSLLEAQAEAWASVQLARMIDHQQWSEKEKAKVGRELGRMRVGPYDSLAQLVPALNVQPNQFIVVTCLPSDLALMSKEFVKPLLPSPGSVVQKVTVDCVKIYSSFMAAFQEGLLARPPLSRRPEHGHYDWLIGVIKDDGAQPASRSSISSVVEEDMLAAVAARLSARLDAALFLWLSDVFYTCHEGAKLRERWPMLLTGDENEFELCVRSIGSPSALSTHGEAAVSIVRELRGLGKRVEFGDLGSSVNEWVHHEVIPILDLMSQLLYSDDRALTRRQDTRVIPVGPSTREILGSYGVALTSFS